MSECNQVRHKHFDLDWLHTKEQEMNGIYAIKPGFQQALKPLESILIRAKVHPDLITFSAFFVSAFGGVSLWISSQPGLLWLLCTTPFVALVRTMLNALDGMVAKQTGLARPWGEVLNEVFDRLSDIAIFAGLAFSRLCNGPLLTASLIAVLLSSYLGVLSKAAGGQRQFGGLMGKADRMILFGLVGPLSFFCEKSGLCPAEHVLNGFLLIVLGGAILTFLQRAAKTYADLQSIH